jgi:hypothetical protein
MNGWAKRGLLAMASIAYIKGDATCPQAKGVKIICHVCNDIGGWGKGFVLAISNRWEEPEVEYRKWHNEGKVGGFVLGAVQFVQVEPYIWIAYMIGQRGIKQAAPGRQSGMKLSPRTFNRLLPRHWS